MFISTLKMIISWHSVFNLNITNPKALFYYTEASQYIKTSFDAIVFLQKTMTIHW